jgi:hypothetical protein
VYLVGLLRHFRGLLNLLLRLPTCLKQDLLPTQTPAHVCLQTSQGLSTTQMVSTLVLLRLPLAVQNSAVTSSCLSSWLDFNRSTWTDSLRIPSIPTQIPTTTSTIIIIIITTTHTQWRMKRRKPWTLTALDTRCPCLCNSPSRPSCTNPRFTRTITRIHHTSSSSNREAHNSHVDERGRLVLQTCLGA